nr:hypothetical protein CFP56_04574 [Quercus suber]POE63681.1 hypothetical protein CFP56_04584 [Quercus suber]
MLSHLSLLGRHAQDESWNRRIPTTGGNVADRNEDGPTCRKRKQILQRDAALGKRCHCRAPTAMVHSSSTCCGGVTPALHARCPFIG